MINHPFVSLTRDTESTEEELTADPRRQKQTKYSTAENRREELKYNHEVHEEREVNTS